MLFLDAVRASHKETPNVSGSNRRRRGLWYRWDFGDQRKMSELCIPIDCVVPDWIGSPQARRSWLNRHISSARYGGFGGGDCAGVRAPDGVYCGGEF